jgi:hypothetical protein
MLEPSSIGALCDESGRQEMALVPDEPAQTAVADERVVCAAHTKEVNLLLAFSEH